MPLRPFWHPLIPYQPLLGSTGPIRPSQPLLRPSEPVLGIEAIPSPPSTPRMGYLCYKNSSRDKVMDEHCLLTVYIH